MHSRKHLRKSRTRSTYGLRLSVFVTCYYFYYFFRTRLSIFEQRLTIASFINPSVYQFLKPTILYMKLEDSQQTWSPIVVNLCVMRGVVSLAIVPHIYFGTLSM